MFAVLHVGGFFTVQHDNKMRTLRRDFIDIPFAGGFGIGSTFYASCTAGMRPASMNAMKR